MTNNELIITLARMHGLENPRIEGENHCVYTCTEFLADGPQTITVDCPPYLHSHDALAPVLQMLDKEGWDNFRDKLAIIMKCAWYQSQILLKATPEQKARALVKAHYEQ